MTLTDLLSLVSPVRDRFISKGASSERVKRSLQLNAAIDIDTVELTDTGYYGVQISMQAKDHQGNEVKQEFKAAALLTVGGIVCTMPLMFDPFLLIRFCCCYCCGKRLETET